MPQTINSKLDPLQGEICNIVTAKAVYSVLGDVVYSAYYNEPGKATIKCSTADKKRIEDNITEQLKAIIKTIKQVQQKQTAKQS